MSVIRIAEVPYERAGFGGALTYDLVRGNGSAGSFFPVQKWQDVAAKIDGRPYPREALRDLLERDARRFNAPGVVLQNIASLADSRTYVVATGQQAGFLGGPLFALHKALTAVKLARQFTAEANGASVVPIFWVAGDDHDLAEIDHTYLLDAAGTLIRADAPAALEFAGCSACDARLTRDPVQIDSLKSELLKVLPENAVNDCLALYGSHSYADAFTALLYRWLGGTGLIVVQSQQMRVFARELLRQELNEFTMTSAHIREAGEALIAAGYEPGFPAGGRVAPHFFIAHEPRKIRTALDPLPNGKFQLRSSASSVSDADAASSSAGVSPASYSAVELSTMIDSRPDLFSASAALRPVLQQRIFPVVATVLGPGEIAYWAQLSKVHEQFHAIFPLVLPRATLTLIDDAGEKSLRKLGVPFDSAEMFLSAAALQEKILKASTTGQKIETHRQTILTEFDAMAAEVHSVDAGLRPLFTKAREKIGHELQRIAEKTHASIARHDEATGHRIQYLSGLVRPRNEPQERVLSAGQFMHRFPNLPEDLLSIIDPNKKAHQIVQLSI